MSASNGSAPDPITADWSDIADYTAAIWAQRMAETVAEAARWRAVATAAQRRLAELATRIEALEARQADSREAADAAVARG